MVRIEFWGAWKDEDVQAVRDVTVTGIEKNLKISVLPAYFARGIFFNRRKLLGFLRKLYEERKNCTCGV